MLIGGLPIHNFSSLVLVREAMNSELLSMTIRYSCVFTEAMKKAQHVLTTND